MMISFELEGQKETKSIHVEAGGTHLVLTLLSLPTFSLHLL